MSIASALMRLASIGLTEEQARAVGEVITDIQLASEAANDVRRASDRERKRLIREAERLRKSEDVRGQDRKSGDGEDKKPPEPHARVFSIGEEEVVTTSLRSVAADAAPDEKIFENARQELWAVGKELLAELGLSPSKASTMIGRWLKETGDDAPAVLDAIRRARQHKPVNPVAWIVRALPTAKPSNGRSNPETSVHAAIKELCDGVAGGSIAFGPAPPPYVLTERRDREREEAPRLLPKG